VEYVTSPTQISSLPARDAPHYYRRGSVNRDTAAYPFHLILRKCLNITRLSGGGKAATLPSDLPFDRLVTSHGENLNTCKSQIQQRGRSKRVDNKSKEVYATWNVREG